MLMMVWLFVGALATLAALHTKLRATRGVCLMRSLEWLRMANNVAGIAGAAINQMIRMSGVMLKATE